MHRFLGVSTWDGFVKILDVQNPNSPGDKRNQYHHKPVLSFTFMVSSVSIYQCYSKSFQGSAECIVSGDSAGNVKKYDIETGRDASMGRHESAVRCLEYSPMMHWAVSGGWDKLVKLWDVRTSMPVHATEVDDKVYALATTDYKAVVGTSDRKIIVFDLRNMKVPIQNRESPLKVCLG